MAGHGTGGQRSRSLPPKQGPPLVHHRRDSFAISRQWIHKDHSLALVAQTRARIRNSTDICIVPRQGAQIASIKVDCDRHPAHVQPFSAVAIQTALSKWPKPIVQRAFGLLFSPKPTTPVLSGYELPGSSDPNRCRNELALGVFHFHFPNRAVPLR